MLIHGLTLTASTVVQLVSLGVPLLVAFLAHKNAPSWLKGGLNAVLAALTGAVGVLVGTNGGYDWQAFVQAIITALVASAASYVVVVKHIGGPQLEQVGLSLGQSLATTVANTVTGKHRAVPVTHDVVSEPLTTTLPVSASDPTPAAAPVVAAPADVLSVPASSPTVPTVSDLPIPFEGK